MCFSLQLILDLLRLLQTGHLLLELLQGPGVPLLLQVEFTHLKVYNNYLNVHFE